MSTPGVDTLNNNNHTQAGPVVNKNNGLNKEFNSKAWTLSSAAKP
ncbi:hypothetical protein PF005_g32721 [Phytophthora fragariae]|nr:hypothetical protein PF009_g25463 [Phytophthora fragariae]KAE9075742.1 hypothetical protein PF010_g24182 [Phytophthora fragariae]KAE9077755.1 hypothetical protein PF006_g27857 [Phytophthora fragariae]KAE9157740.1 hypothetical protein PF005_g32721 [Phytophthora fragariae]KAE9167737.1 hypothetical protein PF004_g28722 [Phytophthora fragariae]